ncbi:hypothetical protein HME9302_01878 [Alteripontixanthobacter maritimus]|uniref:Uncharacterized protein n=1 Tax=Alteripontixanthobacter maritimus TaxID=2161824 RepID=A0A369Q728_9SPHN|nr:hypothetical protein [Alteripontixanthobacter maritimus]RDC60663.1 hypothetical protein HME9302_01878 [Alteripontixanthobacter maritimus]
MAKKSKPEKEHITDKMAAAIDGNSSRAPSSETREIAGPSPNPATNLILYDIALRGIGRLTRHTLQKGLLRRSFDAKLAKDIVENRSMLSTLASYGVTKIATRSIPGAVLVSTGMVAKTLFDRSQSRRSAKRAGLKQLDKQAEE